MKIIDTTGSVKTAQGWPSVATQAEMEAATSTTLAVTPGRNHYHPGVAKAWVAFNATGTLAVLSSYNVTSVTDHGTGTFTVNWDTDFSNTNYAVVVNGHEKPSTHVAVPFLSEGGSGGGDTARAAGSVSIRCFTVYPSLAGADIEYNCVAAFGDQ